MAHLRGEYTFPLPTYPGDALHVEFEVTEVRPSKTKPDRGILGWLWTFKNQRDEVVLEYRMKALYARKPKE